MALVFTIPADGFGSAGDQRVVRGTIAFDSSYVTGGMAFTLGQAGYAGGRINRMIVDDTGGYAFTANLTTNKIQAFMSPTGPGVVNANVSPVSSGADATEDDLMTYTLPANALGANGASCRVYAAGTTFANGDTKLIRLYFGGTAIWVTTAVAANAKTWSVNAEIVRLTATTQEIYATGFYNDVLMVNGGVPTRTAGASDLTTALIIKCTGTGNAAQAGDVIQRVMRVELMSAPGTGSSNVEVPNATNLSGLSAVTYTAWGY